MKKILAALLFLPSISLASWFAGSGPDYSQQAGNMYICSSSTTLTTQVGASQVNQLITLINPPGSGKNIVLLDVGININASPAAAAQFNLAFSTGVVAPSTTVQNTNNGFITTALIGKSTTTTSGICLLNWTAPTIPRAFRYLGGTTGASGIGAVVMTDYTNGKVVVSPGTSVSIQATSAASITAHFTEREDPI